MAVVVAVISPQHDAELVDIEVRISGYQRIKSPEDEPDSFPERVLPLGQFDLIAEVLVSESGFDSEHVGMICRPPFTKCDGSVSECYEPVRACERAQSGRIASLRDLIKPHRHYVDVFVLPDPPFQVYALLEVSKRDAFSYCVFIVSHKIAV